ncbi:MAG: efflux transporter outer membrane subunit [Desulfobacteraceae bacterium]|nr:MAG: efflux transporter outer membrane subunit [Desulfobacteraceae bacterium]
MNTSLNIPILVIISGLLISGCQLSTPQVSEPDLPVPDTYTLEMTGVPPANPWWEAPENRSVTRLIQSALNRNPSILIQEAKVRQAAAAVEKTNADLLPYLGWTTHASEQISHSRLSHTSKAGSSDSQTWSAGLNGSYDPDIWGSLEAEQKADVLTHQAAIEDLNETAAQLTTDIAATVVDIIAARQKVDILNSQIVTNEALLELQKLRFINGKSSALEVSQQQETLAAAKAQIPPLKRQERILLNTLDVLLGGVDRSGPVDIDPVFFNIDIPTSGIPADLLSNRPDIRAAQMRFRAAGQQVHVAKADLMPSLTISANALFSSGKLDLLLENWALTLAASLAGPLFDGGKRQAELNRTIEVGREKAQSYKKAVVQAIKEVEDSLVTLDTQAEYIHLLEEQLAASRITLKDARIQYQNGKSSYLSYLTAWGGIQRLEVQLISERALMVKEKIELYRALGWNTPDMKLRLTLTRK